MSAMPDRCAECAVRDLSLCASLANDELEALNSIARTRSLERGQVLVWEGDRSTVCANVMQGVLKVTSATADGREQIVGLYFPGDFVGQPFREEASLTVTAVGDATLCVYPRDRFQAVLDDHARLERMLLRRTMAALDDARTRMLTLGRKTAEEKVAGFLVEMLERLEADQCNEQIAQFDLPITRGQMADVLGLTIETVSRQLTRLRGDAIIELPQGRTVTILDRAALEAAAGTG